MDKKYSRETLCVQAGWTPKKGEPRVLPIYQSTTFKYDTSEQMARLFDLEDSGYFYTRLQNPTNDAVAAKIAALEGGVGAMLTSSGQAANFYAIFNICQAGDHFVCSSTIYGGTFNLFGVTLKKLDQAKIAIGSGGLRGKGFLNGTQTKLKYVPEQDTDFIFCTVGEEEGFWGAAGVLVLFLVLILRLIHLAERQPFAFGRIYGYCVMSVFLFHVFINVGMVLGLTPVIGIPLPFFSYGARYLA